MYFRLRGYDGCKPTEQIKKRTYDVRMYLFIRVFIDCIVEMSRAFSLPTNTLPFVYDLY